MLEFLMNNIFKFFEALEQNKVLLTCVLIYMIGFVLLAICGVWEYVQNKYNNSNQQNIRVLISKYKIISRLIEYLAIVYLPILIPFWLMLAVCKSIYWLIHNYAENFFHSLLMVCLLPITIFNIFGEKLTKKI